MHAKAPFFASPAPRAAPKNRAYVGARAESSGGPYGASTSRRPRRGGGGEQTRPRPAPRRPPAFDDTDELIHDADYERVWASRARPDDDPSSTEPSTQLNMYLDRLATIGTARSLAVSQLIRIEDEGAYAALASGDAASSNSSARRPLAPPSSPSAARFATEVVSGVTRYRRRIKYTLEHLPDSNIKLDTMDAPLRVALQAATYEFLEQGRPDHVANEYVELVKQTTHAGCARVANFTLRQLLRSRDAGRLPPPPSPPPSADAKAIADALGIASSHPTWLVARWLSQYGRKTTGLLLRASNRRPAYALRLSPWLPVDDALTMLGALDERVSVERSSLLPDSFVVVREGLQAVLAAGVVGRGDAAVQDQAAGLVVAAALDPQPGETVLDCCAAPGGKSLFASARMQGKGRLIALDVSGARLAALRRVADAHRISPDFLQTVAGDARQYCVLAAQDHPSELFDRVLLDAPCSGTGVLSKRADLRWRRTPQDVRQLTALQRELLAAAAGAVAPGGLLVYSTCSLEAEENMGAIDDFLASPAGKDFVLEALPEGAVPDDCRTERGEMLMLPHLHGTDGAFAARLRRT